MEFAKKNVVITGGATGIGFALAKGLCARGARVLITGLEQDRLDASAAQLHREGRNAETFRGDVTAPGHWESLAEYAWSKLGTVDILINNAGIGAELKNVFECNLSEARRVLDVNFFSVWQGIQTFGKRFLDQGTDCAIYNLGSENSLFNAVPTNAPYIASKHAMLALTQALREDAPNFMATGLICPGLVISQLTKFNQASGMPTDEFAESALRQMEDNQFLIVSHSYNRVRIDDRHREAVAAFEKYAPRYEGDDEYDIRAILATLAKQN